MEKEFEDKIGESGYVNQNCWLAKNLNYPPTKHCRYCESKFHDCLFFRYTVISFILVFSLIILTLILEGTISNPVIISIFVLVITYGYYFDRSTEKIVIANFTVRKSKEALEDLNKNLQHKVDEQTQEIRKAYEIEKNAKEQLEVIGDIKNQFLMTIQHHLRTPLTSMMGYADLLLGGTFGKMPKKIEDVVKKFEASTVSLIKMVNEFLDITQFQLGKEVVSLKEGVNLCPIFKEIINDVELEAKKKGIYVKIEKPEASCTVKADESKLKAALMNIFDNSVKYTNTGGVKIKMGVNNDIVRVEIKDTGMGIPKERLPKLFDIIFERTDEAKRSFATGRGIGLYLSSQVIKAHNGKIWVESEGEGKGSTFFIELPIEHKKDIVVEKQLKTKAGATQ